MVSRAQAWFRRRSVKRRALRASLLLLNIAMLVAVVLFVVLNPSHSSSAPRPVATMNGLPATAKPLDQLASVSVAVTVAKMTNMLEAPAVTSLYNSDQIQLAVASTNNTFVNKPQIVRSSLPSRHDIHTYVTKTGDTISGIAAAYGVSTNSVLWSNGLTGNGLVAGKLLYIPPVNGIVYSVKNGDTPATLATKFHSNEAKIIAVNDADASLGGLQPGELILIPDGEIIIPVNYYATFGFAWGNSAIYGFNGYDWGNCTWYVATQIQIPANWGNAATWAAGARAAGWHVSSVPTVGAIAQTPYAAGGLGHVAIIDGISPDGKQLLIRDMNGIAGFGRVGIAWESTSLYQNFITR